LWGTLATCGGLSIRLVPWRDTCAEGDQMPVILDPQCSHSQSGGGLEVKMQPAGDEKA